MGVLSIVQLLLMACGEREAMVTVPPLHMTQQYHLASMAAWLSSTSISHNSLLHHTPLIPSPPSTAAPPWDCSMIPKTPAPSCCPFQETSISVQDMYACSKDCLISFHLCSHRSAVSLLALNVSPLTQTIALLWGLDSCFSSPAS